MRRVIAAAVASIFVAACGGSSPAPNVDAAKVLRDSGAAMAQVRTVNATLTVTKGTISLQGFTLVKARTTVELPTDSDTVYSVKEQDLLISFEVIITAGHVYLHLPLSTFQEVKGAQAAEFPDLAKMFDPSTGLPALIPEGANPKYVSTDQVDGVPSYYVSTTYSAAQVHSLLPQLTSDAPVHADIWVGTTDHLIRKAVLDGRFGDGGKEAALEIDMTGFNSPVTIGSPTP